MREAFCIIVWRQSSLWNLPLLLNLQLLSYSPLRPWRVICSNSCQQRYPAQCLAECVRGNAKTKTSIGQINCTQELSQPSLRAWGAFSFLLHGTTCCLLHPQHRPQYPTQGTLVSSPSPATAPELSLWAGKIYQELLEVLEVPGGMVPLGWYLTKEEAGRGRLPRSGSGKRSESALSSNNQPSQENSL